MTNTSYYYIPLCNKDFTFENIFSTESISPISFYSKRNFGIAHFYKFEKYYLDDALLLYSSIPKITLDQVDGIKFILAIERSEIEKEDILFISEGIIGIQKTFYLTKSNFKVLFFSEKDMKLVLGKAELSLPTKATKKYYQNFEIIDESMSVDINTENIKKINLLDRSSQEVLFDKKFNTIKGFIYGLITEIAFAKSPEEIKLKRGIQKLVNEHAEFKNKFESRNKQLDNRYAKAGSPSSIYFDKVIDTLNLLERLVSSIFPKTEISPETISKILFEKNKSLFQSLEEAITYLRQKYFDRHFLNSEDYDRLKKKAVSSLKTPDANFLIELIKDSFKKSFTPSGTFLPTKFNPNYNDDEFKEAIFKLNFVVDNYFYSRKSNVQIDFKDIVYDSHLNQIELNSNFGFGISTADEKEFITLANIILQKSKQTKGEAKKDDLLEIIKDGANAHNKTIATSETLLYKYFNNQIDVYPLDKVNSVVMKNFVAFIFNPDSLESLEKFLQANEIQFKWMAYSYWCAFNGFANISSIFLRPIFEKDVEIQDALDSYLLSIRNKLAKKLSINNEVADKEKKSSREEDFFNKYIKYKFDLELEDLITLLEIKKDSDKLKVLKTKYGIDNKTGKNILSSYKEFIQSPHLF